MTWIVLKFSFTVYTFNDHSTICKNYPFQFKNVSLFKRQLIIKVESFLKSNFDLNQRYKKSAITSKLLKFGTSTLLAYIFIMIGEML